MKRASISSDFARRDMNILWQSLLHKFLRVPYGPWKNNYFHMKYCVLVLLLFVGLSYASAQDVYTSSGKTNYKKKKEHKGYDPDKLIIGGGINGGVSGGAVTAGLSPIVGYRISKNFSAGIGVGYLYTRYPDYYDAPNDKLYYASANLVYPSVWARYIVWRNIYATTAYEYDFINVKKPIDRYGNVGVSTKYSYTNSCLWLGAGLKQPIAGRVSLFAELRFDVLRQQTSPYLNGPDIRVGVVAGL